MRETLGRPRDAGRSARRTVRDIHAAERELQDAAMAAERRQALASVDAGLQSLHASRVAAVVSKYAHRRVALAHMVDAGARAAASQQIAMEEANELVCLAVEHAGEKRQARKKALSSLRGRHHSARRRLQRRQRLQRAGLAVQLRSLRPATVADQATRARIQRGMLVGCYTRQFQAD